MSATRVMIVDDSAVVRRTLGELLEEDSDIQVAETASDPVIASKKLPEVRPDVIILDVEMPKMDGLTFLRKIMAERPLPVIICSSKTEEGSQNAILALEYGAVEIIRKPKLGTKQFLEDSKVMIIDAVKAAHLSSVRKKRPSSTRASTSAKGTVSSKRTADVVLARRKSKASIETTETIVVIGASTGGTEALRTLLQMLPLNAPPMVVVQHMPEHFTTAFADRLNGLCTVTIKEATNGESLLRGTVLIAPGNRHTLLKRSGARYFLEVKDGPLVSRHRPSVDVLFRSTARYAGQNAVGVILTGMGDDGANGLREMKEAGSYNIAQDEESCVVFGMPHEAIQRGAVEAVMPLDKIASAILSRT
jgi:two-component system chemotaxis response regulator CheB